MDLYIEEAASVAVSDLLSRLPAQSLSFGCLVTLSMQFPAQLREQNLTAYDEVLNNDSTVITGNVPIDRRPAERLVTDDMDARSVGNRLRALRRGQWLVILPAAFDTAEPPTIPRVVAHAATWSFPWSTSTFETAPTGLRDRIRSANRVHETRIRL